MSQYNVQHPTRPELLAYYGWDRAIDYFVEVTDGLRPIAEYDSRMPGYRFAAGVLDALVEHGFCTRDELDEPRRRLDSSSPTSSSRPHSAERLRCS